MTKVQHFTHDGTLVRAEDIPDAPERVAERTATTDAVQALAALQVIADGTGPMTAAQLTTAVRGMARTMLVLVRLVLRRFDT